MSKNEISGLLDQLYYQAKMQFGTAIKGRWFYDGDDCPGCGRKISTLKYKGKDAMSVNVYIYREHGILIAYLLCGKCGRKVINAKSNLPLHTEIEKTLKQAFVKTLGH